MAKHSQYLGSMGSIRAFLWGLPPGPPGVASNMPGRIWSGPSWAMVGHCGPLPINLQIPRSAAEQKTTLQSFRVGHSPAKIAKDPQRREKHHGNIVVSIVAGTSPARPYIHIVNPPPPPPHNPHNPHNPSTKLTSACHLPTASLSVAARASHVAARLSSPIRQDRNTYSVGAPRSGMQGLSTPTCPFSTHQQDPTWRI